MGAMADFSTATFLFYDPSGGFSHICESIAPDVGKALYYSHWQNSFPRSRDALPGIGLDGVERVPDFFDALSQADVVVFPDCGNVGLQNYLRNQGIPIWGSGTGSKMEQDRWALKTVLRECGLPVAEAELIQGLDALREYLQKHEDVYVKISYFRGDLETFHHRSYFASQAWLDDLGSRFGPYQSEAQFIVEQPIEGHAVEVGIDGFLVDGQLLAPTLWGYEAKDLAYLGTIGEVPDRLLKVQNCLTPVLEQIAYRGPFSIEVRVTEDDDFVIDVTARYPSPPSEAQCVAIENMAEIIYEGAHGREVVPVYRAPYLAQLVLRSAWGMEHALGLEVGRPEHVLIHGHCRIDGCDYAISPSEIEEFGAAVGMGNSVADAIADAFDAADSVKGYQVNYDAGAFDKALECIRDGEGLGLPWGRMSTEKAA